MISFADAGSAGILPAKIKMDVTRIDGRASHELRPVVITPDYLNYAEGSALIELGRTRVICAASVEERLPPHLRNQRTEGWVTAEYSMLPRSTHTRSQRETGRGGLSGRTHEIQRLIGRSLRTIADRTALGERTITLDCDVLQADGGTRTAAITGAYVAFAIACARLLKARKISRSPIVGEVAAVSVGIVDGTPLLDLKYEEDSRADVDMNVVCTGDGRFIEVQGTAERHPFNRQQMDELLELAGRGIEHLVRVQREAIHRVKTAGA
jgi:ribonuclease PH